MARDERSGNCWSQPRRSTPAKSRSSCSRGLGTGHIGELDDIVNVLSGGDRSRQKHNEWSTGRHVSNRGSYSSGDCCLKNGRVQCSCLWPKCYPEQRKNTHNFPRPFNHSTLPYENKTSLWPDKNVSNGCFQDDKMLEEFILDDNELGLLNYYDIPLDVPRQHHVRNVGKVKTVSIIDTLSELASGATDREDEGGFSSAVSESAVLNRYVYKPRARHVRQAGPRRDRGARFSYLPSSNVPNHASSIANKHPLGNSLKAQYDALNNIHTQNFIDDGNFTCSSLKRTLKYLRKAVSTHVVEEEARNKKHLRDIQDDAFRQCFSDSEVKAVPQQWTPFKNERLDLSPRTKSKSLLTVIDPIISKPVNPGSSLFRSRTKAAVPDWIQEVFSAAKKGDTEKMKLHLKDIDLALVRNLSDDHGNNLWHICAVHNNFECLSWLCSSNPHHVDALKDENKNGFSPVALAVKHGSLLAVKWLIHNTVSKTQLLPQTDSRSLLHVAARYGQEAIVQWLLSYMTTQDLDASIVDSEGNTALHLASKAGYIACVKALVFQTGNLKTRNEHGLKPLDLAVKHCRKDCADYLVAMESCYNLAALNLRQHSEIQQLQKENAEMKSYFKELLTLTKRLQHRQKELVHSITHVNTPPQFLNAGERASDKSRYLDDYSQLLSTVMTDEEHNLLMVEDRWKKSRKHTKLSENRKKPLDVLRSQFNHILDKVVSQSPPIPSTPETSDGSWHSGDEDVVPVEKTFPEFLAPDVVNSLSPEISVPYLDTKQKQLTENAVAKTNNESVKYDLKEDSTSFKNVTAVSVPPKSMTNRDVNLRMFFKQNPNLRQSSETCSVLEVLEPSSSDSEECSNHKRLSKSYNPEREIEQSSSSSAIETLSPYSCRPSSSGSKASGSHSSSSGGRQNPFSPVSAFSPCESNLSSSEKNAREDENISNDIGENNATDHLSRCDNISSEPDLIKGTQKKKILNLIEKEKKNVRNSVSDLILNDNPSISTEDSESLEVDRSFSSMTDMPDHLVPVHNPECPIVGTAVKKKSFLLKFALRGRWPSKTPPRSLKNEISPEEFRETYSRSALVDVVPPASQLVAIPDNILKKNLHPLKCKIESTSSSTEVLESGTTASNERINEVNRFPLTPGTEGLNQAPIRNRRGLLPPRRDPPPAPPINDEAPSQDHSDDDLSVNVQKSSVSSCVEDCLTPSVSLHESLMGSQVSDLWHSPDSKSLFRPASSASRVDSLSRGEEGFSLNKSSSASTEMLSALDTSTAGRQSPAPSEVSKTESALSPPSDVSKTESTRYLSQLGRIEETGHLTVMKVSNLKNEEEQTVKETLNTDVKVDSKHKKKSNSKKVNSDKPWYEFSDEEDIIVPQRYKAVSVSRGSSEDEGAITG